MTHNFKVGDKVKIPTRKSICLPLNQCSAIPRALALKQDFLFITKIVNNNTLYLGGNIGELYSSFTPEDLELYDEFVLPEKWCILRNKDNHVIINNYLNRLSGFNGAFDNRYYIYLESSIPSKYGAPSCIPEGYTEITFEQFKKYVLKENDMTTKVEKKLIGYKLIKPEYAQIAKYISGLSNPSGHQVLELGHWNMSISAWKKAGVLDLWFEPVYEEDFKPKTFEIGSEKLPVTINKGSLDIDGIKFVISDINKIVEEYNLINT